MFEWLERLAHDYLGWHDGMGGPRWFDGLSVCGHCSRCGKQVLMDSQGNWFLATHQDPEATE